MIPKGKLLWSPVRSVLYGMGNDLKGDRRERADKGSDRVCEAISDGTADAEGFRGNWTSSQNGNPLLDHGKHI